MRPEPRGGERAGPPAATIPVIPDDARVLPMYVRKANVATYVRTPVCKGFRDVVIERPQCAPHSRECGERMERLLSETEGGRQRVKA